MTLFSVDDAGGRPVRQVSLVRLANHIARAANDIGRLAVEGEVHRVQEGKGGRRWFTLRDRAAQISVSVPSGRRARCRTVAGERVCVTGQLEWVAGWGQLQLVADEIVPVGDGAVAAAIAEARERLRVEGVLDRPRRPIPPLPAAIGVVCGADAAVRADIESVVVARFPGYPVVFRETTVSGPGAVDGILAALSDLDGRADVEVIILARGGGDATQLLPFSDEDLCRAVASCATPVVAAIGHDGDRPLVDEVADLRCGTPSIAAARVVPDEAALRAELDRVLATARVGAAAAVERATRRHERLAPAAAIAGGLQLASTRLDRAGARLAMVDPARLVAPAASRLGALRREMDALSPVRVLERGYAVVRAPDGVVVRDASVLDAGDRVSVRVAAGDFAAVVEPSS